MNILGLHHITLVTTNAQRNLDFYTGVLGLRFIKQTVNFDDPTAYHLYYGDGVGTPGTAITFFEWKLAGQGRPGIGGTHHFALTVRDRDALLKWKRRLGDLGISVAGPYDRSYFNSIYFRDPDGTIIELATEGPGFTADEAADALGKLHITPRPEVTTAGRNEADIAALTWHEAVPGITPDMALMQGMHHISAVSSDIQRTHAFFGDLLGMDLVKQTDNYDDPSSKHWYWSGDAGDGRPGTLLTYFEQDPRSARMVRMGAGQTHHYALAVADAHEQLAWREKLVTQGLRVSPVMNRDYFRSIYTNDPDGHILEIATVPPGFTVDEPVEALGQALQLPDFLEPYREAITANLTPLKVPAWNPPQEA